MDDILAVQSLALVFVTYAYMCIGQICLRRERYWVQNPA